jgi:hypothetical protein
MAADRMQTVARALNQVASVGQERAALTAARAELDRGAELASGLNSWTSPTVDQAYDTIALQRAALDAEARALSSSADDSPIDAINWPRVRRQIERSYVEVSGIEGAAGAVDAIDVGGILADAIADAPRVFGEAVGSALRGAGEVAGKAGAGALAGLGVLGVLVLVVVVVLAVKVH